MHFICRMRSANFQSLTRASFGDLSTQLAFLGKVFYSQASCADSEVNCLKLVPRTFLEAEKEEVKAVLTLFLKKQHLSNAIAARTIEKSDHFIEHLVSRLHSVHKPWNLVGHELTRIEIRDALLPYLESLQEAYGNDLLDVVETFPNPLVKEKPVAPPPASLFHLSFNSKRLKALSRVSKIGPVGELRAELVYLVELGIDLDQIKSIRRRFPPFAYCILEGKITSLVEFLLDLGVLKSDIPSILKRAPQLCGLSLSENIIPNMAFLESLGLDKKHWAKVINRSPFLLCYSRQKVKTNVDYLYEMGLSAESICKILVQFPQIIGSSVDDKLRPTAEYFRSLGVDVAVLLCRVPQIFSLSIEANLKPVTEFFLKRGFSLVEVGTMISRFGGLYTLSLAKNLKPKWEFFLTTGYPQSELVKFPTYFGYSLEQRIKLRYDLMKERGVVLPLFDLLIPSSNGFDKALKMKMKKKTC